MNALLVLACLLQAPSKEEKPPPPPPGFFKTSEVDFWGEKAAQSKKKEAEDKWPQESLWAEPIKLPDGRTQVYLPPKAVLQFLDAPSKETAKEYVAWQEERMKRLKAAMEILRQLQEEHEAPAAPPAAPPSLPEAPAPAPASPPAEILYFKRASCPWCAKEDGVLASLLQSHPRLQIRQVLIEDAPDLARAAGVTVVPTLVLRSKSGKSLALQGFMTKEQIEGSLQELGRAEK
jgi:hypothetical protein